MTESKKDWIDGMLEAVPVKPVELGTVDLIDSWGDSAEACGTFTHRANVTVIGPEVVIDFEPDGLHSFRRIILFDIADRITQSPRLTREELVASMRIQSSDPGRESA